MPYKDFTATDFILDDYFKNWVVAPDAETEKFWQDWLTQYPGKQADVAEAREFILRMQFITYSPSREEFNQDWQRLTQEIEDVENQHTSEDAPVISLREETDEPSLWRRWRGIAASIGVLLLVASGYFLYTNVHKVTVYTPYGAIKQVVLADQTIVTLNANSKLTYRPNWNFTESREVWLEGEAFFEVQKKADKKKFIVHTPTVNVEVLGTRFNVHNRRKEVQVVLNEGKVRLHTQQKTANTDLVMKVGDWVTFSDTSKKFYKKSVNPDIYSSWKNKEWILDNITLQEVALKIEETYGVQVQIQGTHIARQTVTGVVPTESLEILLNALGTAFDLKIAKQTPKLIIIKS